MARARRVLRMEESYPGSGFAGTAVLERPAGSGSIVAIRRGNRGYQEARAWVVDELGNKHRKTKLCHTYGDAEKALRDLLTNSEDVRKMKLGAFLDRWLAQAKGDIRPNTYRLYKHIITTHIKPHLRQATVGSFQSPNARAFLAKLEENGVSASIRREVHKVLRRAFQVATLDESITRNPMASVARPKVEKKPEHIPSRDEAIRLLAEAAKGPWHLLIRMALVTGMREGELFALVADDLKLDGESPYLIVNATLTEAEDGSAVRTPPKTTASVRRIELDELTAAMLRERVRDLERHSFIFTTATGSTIRKSNFLRRDFLPMVERAKLPRIRFHSLRKVANTLLLASGDASIIDLQNRLGHTTPAMTLQTYAKELPHAQRSIAKKAGELFKS